MIVLLLTGLIGAAPAGAQAVGRITLAQTIVVRTRAQAVLALTPLPPTYREKKGPACVDAAAIAGAAVMAPNGVDFILKGGQRMRARLEDACPGLDYYRGFYVSPNPDGRICAGRDAIRTRSGGECQIERFRKLSAIPPKAVRPPAP